MKKMLITTLVAILGIILYFANYESIAYLLFTLFFITETNSYAKQYYRHSKKTFAIILTCGILGSICTLFLFATSVLSFEG